MTAPSFFLPSQKIISSIIRGTRTTSIFTQIPHGYTSGLVVRLFIPEQRGIRQLNGQVGEIVVITPTLLRFPVVSSSFDPFIPYALPFNPNNEPYLAQIIPIAENALTLDSVTENSDNIVPEITGTPPAPLYP